MVTTHHIPEQVPPFKLRYVNSADKLQSEEQALYGWSPSQWAICISYLMDTHQLHRDDLLFITVNDAAMLQNKWYLAFPTNPTTGAAQLYTPRISKEAARVTEILFAEGRAKYA